ncbi:MAG: hypothetical protein Q8L44_10440 [Sulfuritalea sp.]|nr:hypothetical protein [Sulfuritalea sp.]
MTRLASAQYDAHHLIADLLANAPDGPESRILCFHHHIEEHHGCVRILSKKLTRLISVIGIKELDTTIAEREVLQDKFCRNMNIGLIVGDEDLPCGLSLRGGDFRFFGKKEIIGLIVC